MLTLSKNPTPDEIRALAELPYGQAEKVLIDNNLWDWSKDPRFKEYTLYVNSECYDPDSDEDVPVEGWVNVWATSVEHARSIWSEGINIRDIEWDLGYDLEVDDIDPHEIYLEHTGLSSEPY